LFYEMFVSPRGGSAQRNPPFFDYEMAGYADAVIAETLEREAKAAAQARRAGWHCTVENAAASLRSMAQLRGKAYTSMERGSPAAPPAP
jgi:hypothetical protein